MTLLVEGEVRRLRPWDFFHSPPWTGHAFVGAGEGPCTILMVGSRSGPGVRYPVSELAARYGASVAEETSDWRQAYATGRAVPAQALADLGSSALGVDYFGHQMLRDFNGFKVATHAEQRGERSASTLGPSALTFSPNSPMPAHRSQPSRAAPPAEGAAYTTRPLDASTWDAFAELVERNNGVYGGCWCIAFHTEYQRGVSDPRTLKEQLVRAGRAHSALVFDQDGAAQGWCQYGSPKELGLKHHREYLKDPPPRADWRITCIFVDQRHRGLGIARAALEGALAEIAAAGGGRVEAISEVTTGREAQARFLFSATVELFEQYGFARWRQVGKHAWIVSRRVDAS